MGRCHTPAGKAVASLLAGLLLRQRLVAGHSGWAARFGLAFQFGNPPLASRTIITCNSAMTACCCTMMAMRTSRLAVVRSISVSSPSISHNHRHPCQRPESQIRPIQPTNSCMLNEDFTEVEWVRQTDQVLVIKDRCSARVAAPVPKEPEQLPGPNRARIVQERASTPLGLHKRQAWGKQEST